MSLSKLVTTVTVAAALALTSVAANAVLINLESDEYLGSVVDNNPPASNANTFLEHVNFLISLAVNTSSVSPASGEPNDEDVYSRSGNDCSDPSCPVAVIVGDTQGGGGNEDASAGWNYLIQGYGSNLLYVWDISDLTAADDITTPTQIGNNQQNNWRAFLAEESNGETCPDGSEPPCEDPPNQVPEPGTLGLLGLGLLGLAMNRRRKV